jgi:uncharacterized protein (TIGR02001 family)
MIKSASFGAVSLLAMAAMAGPALADGMPSRGRVADAPAPRACSTTANVGLTTDYVWRGISQTFNDPALQGGVDFTCGRFYAGVWGSNVDFGAFGPADTVATLEVDLYAGFKHSMGPLNFDVGFIYYAYPGQASGADLNFFELKAGVSGDIYKGGTLGGTVFYDVDNEILTLEGTFAHTFAKVGMFSPTLSATLGNRSFDDGDDYTYWNLGLTVGFMEKWSLDVRYWDTNIDGGCNTGYGDKLCDDRVVGTIKYTF